MNLITKLVAVVLLAVVAFMFGGNQHRTGGWPFGHSVFVGVTRASDDERKKEREEEREALPWIEKLKKGGYLIYLRHANREKWPDNVTFDVYEFVNKIADANQSSFKRAVCLSEQGVEEAKMLGQTFKLFKIPTGTIVSSPSCRAKQTASYAFGRFDYVEDSLLFPDFRLKDQPKGSPERLVDFLKHVEIKAGTNTIIAGHGSILEFLEKGAIEGNTSGLRETGFHIIERQGDNKLVIVFTFKSMGDLSIYGMKSLK